MTRESLLACGLVVMLVAVTLEPAYGHGLIGKRFFPATLATDDPFVADELSLPTVFHQKLRGAEDTPPTKETEVSAELSKRLSPVLGISFGGTFKIVEPDSEKTVSGFVDLAVTLKYVFLQSSESGTVLALVSG